MSKNDGLSQETPNDFHTLQRRRTTVDKYASVNSWLNSVNASPEWQFGHNPGNSTMMLPPNARTGSAMPIFPGPLFPAVRRRRQNIASTSSLKKEDPNIVGHGISLENEKNHHDGLALLAPTNVEAANNSKDEGTSKVVSDMGAFPPINANNSPEIGDYFNGGPSIRNDGGFRDFLSRSISDTGNRLPRGQSSIPPTKSQKYGAELFMATSRLDDTDEKRMQGMPLLKPDTVHLHRHPSNLSNNSGTSPRKLASASHFGTPPESNAQAKRQMTLISSKDESLSESNTLSPRLNSPRESFSTRILAPSHPLPSNLGYFGRWSKCISYWCLSISILLLIALSFCMLRILSLEKEISRLKHISKGCSQMPEGGDEPDSEMSAQDSSRKLALIVSISILLLPIFFIKYVDELPHIYRRLRVSESNQAQEEDEPLSKRLAYRVDVLFSTLPYAKPVALLLATLLLITLGGVALFAVSDQDLWDTLWCSWTYVADSGNHADSVGTGPRIVSVCISFGGMLIFALMLGLVSDAISEKVDSLRKGKSEVIESNHTLILGWSDKMGSLLKQLAIANQSLGGGVVVVLAERDKEEMESDIGKLEFNFMGTSVICRSGSPLIVSDLKKVSVSKARAIIVLAEVENADQSDARALRVVLSLNGVKEGLRGHIVVELCDIDNEPLVKLVGGDLVETVVGHDVIGRLMIQCARQPGLAQIWEDILGFENAEFYIKRWPELDGTSFENVLISFPDAIPCGVKVASDGGRIYLNPDNDYILSDGDEILVVAEDDDSYAPASLPKVRKGFLPTVSRPFKHPEKILFCGWRRDIDDMILVLDSFVVPGSELWIFSEVPKDKRDKKLEDGGLSPEKLANLKLEHREGNPVIRRHLESLPLETFDSILILADEMLEDKIVVADSRSLATLLLIRDIQSKRLPLKTERVAQVRQTGFSHISWICEMEQASNNTIVICEILDSRTKNLVSVTKIGDYVLSNELVSMALAMVAEDKQINRVLEELFSEEGNELYIRSAEFYVYDQEEISFFEIMIRAYERHEIAIGYRQANTERFIINPSERAVRRKWSLDDVLIVLAQDE